MCNNNVLLCIVIFYYYFYEIYFGLNRLSVFRWITRFSLTGNNSYVFCQIDNDIKEETREDSCNFRMML